MRTVISQKDIRPSFKMKRIDVIFFFSIPTFLAEFSTTF